MDQDVYRRMADVQTRHWWYQARCDIIGSVIKSLSLPENPKILEAGCGPGANLRMLETFGKVEAFDPDEFARNHARSLSGATIENGLLPDQIPFDGPFDIIGAFDVIEHVDADRESLITLGNTLKKDGYALFTVPAYKFLWSRHDEANHHKRRYTRPEFARLLQQAGYKVEFISYYNTLLFPLVIATRLMKKITGSDQPDDVIPGEKINRLLRSIFAFERHILKRTSLPFGVSILAVCRKAS